MSGLLAKKTWLGGVAVVALFGFAACGDDDDTTSMPTAGDSGSGGSGAGSAGKSNGGSSGNATAGSSSGGKGGDPASGGAGGTAVAGGGSGGTAAAGTGAGGDGMTVAGQAGQAGQVGQGGDTGVGGSGGDAGAGGEGGGDSLRALFKGMSPLPAVPTDTTNQYADNAAAAALGQRFFFDEKFSGALLVTSDLGTQGDLAKVSCKSCHSGPALDDERSNPATVSIGPSVHTRNSPPLVNSSFYTWTNWAGRFAAQWELPVAVVENPKTMNGTRLAVAHRIFDVYKADYEAVFGALEPAIGTSAARFPASGKPGDVAGLFDAMALADKVIINRVVVNYAKALQAYTRKLVSRESAFDKWMGGDDAALTASEKSGAEVFASKAGCIECHSGPHFTDQAFHDLGTPQTGLNNIPLTDDGRFADAAALWNSPINVNSDYSDDKNTGRLSSIAGPPPLADVLKGQFRTASLRGIAESAPYMHSGQFATLEAVIDFYAAGGTADTAAGNLTAFTVTAQEKTDLIAFLGTLTGKPVDNALLTDTATP